VAHASNPSYSGCRDQEDHSSKPVWTNSPVRPDLKKSFTKIALVEWLKVKALSSSSSTAKKKKRITQRNIWVSHLSVTVTKYRGEWTYKQERLVLAHGFGGFSPLLLGLWQGAASWQRTVWANLLTSYLCHKRRRGRKGPGPQILLRTCPQWPKVTH
jgi:hypothetical protein